MARKAIAKKEIKKPVKKVVKKILKNKIKKAKNANYPWEIGKAYFIRTATFHLLGELTFISDKELVLKDASWVADSGRFYNFLAEGTLNEIEPFVQDVIVNRNSIIDATRWMHALTRHQKP